jgi:hypothetical protein
VHSTAHVWSLEGALSAWISKVVGPKGQRTGEALGARTFVYEGGEEVVDAVEAHVHREQEAHQDLVGKHDDGLHDVEAVPRERRRRHRSA